jgi:hypothetical protein
MATSTMDLYLGAAALYGSEAGAGRSVCSHRFQFRQLECHNRAHRKNIELRQVLALGGRRLGILNNNQPNSWQKQ